MNEEFKSYMEGLKDETKQALDGLRSQWKAHYEELKADGAKHSDAVEKIERALKRLDAVEAMMEKPVGSVGSPFASKTLGQMVVEADGLREFLSATKTADGKSGYRKGSEFRIPVSSIFAFPDYHELKTTITSSAVGSSTPGILVPQRMTGIVPPGVTSIRVRDLLPRFTTENNAVEFVKENVFTNAASPQVESNAKGESALTFTIDYANVKTIATWIPATKQVLDDFKQLQGYIDQRLMDGLKDEEDFQLLRGDGAGSHLEGLLPQAAAYETSRNVSGDTYIDKLNHAISQVEDVNLRATGIILHPRDWRTIQLIKTEEGGANKGVYLLGGPAGNATPMLWGLPVATTTATQVGKFFVGAFATHTAVWDRMDARIDISTEHDTFFTKNMVAIRAEERLTLTVTRSDALIYGSF